MVDQLTSDRLHALAKRFFSSHLGEQVGIEWAVKCMPDDLQHEFARHHDAIYAEKHPDDYARRMETDQSVWLKFWEDQPCPTTWDN